MTAISHTSPPPPTAIVIFGANGDLTKRLIVPALYNLARTGMLPPQLALIGVDHNDKTSAQWQSDLKEFLEGTLSKGGEGDVGKVDDALWGPIAQDMTFLRGDFEKPETYQQLGELLKKIDGEKKLDGNVLFYLATADRFFGTIAG